MLRRLSLVISVCGFVFIAKKFSGGFRNKRTTRSITPHPEQSVSNDLRERLRQEFPSLIRSEIIYFENAGGSQIPKRVADAIHHYMLHSYVQLGAGYNISNIATDTVEAAHSFISLFMNATSDGTVILGPSSSYMVSNLANALAETLKEGDEVVVGENAHEANHCPWARLSRRVKGVKLNYWTCDSKTFTMDESRLEKLLSHKTKIVALTHVSNLLGEVLPLKQLVPKIRSLAPNAKVVVDGVAYAAHRPIDVKEWDVDFYFYSTYKVYGPHMAALFGKKKAFQELTGPNWDFIDRNCAYKWEVGGVLHEGCAGLLALRSYINQVLERPVNAEVDRDAVVKAFSLLSDMERPLTQRLLSYFNSKAPVLRVIGPSDPDSPSRVPTICFVHSKMKSSILTKKIQQAGIATRSGNMYCLRLCESLAIDQEGVVRISLLHYNTLEEVERLIECLNQTL